MFECDVNTYIYILIMMYYIFVKIAFELAWLYLLGDRYERHGILYKKLLDVQ